MTANGLSGVSYHNVIKSTGNSAVYKPCSNIHANPLTDDYTVGDSIGRGKFAVVKKCISLETGEEVAAKFIKKRRRGKSCREEILREVVMLEMVLDHPRLVNLKEVYETQTELILITEYCAGGELFTECILEEKFNESDVRLLISQILEGLVYLHDKNIVHLDLKPQNILLTTEFPQGSVKICDLGFACLVNIGEDIRDIIGTPDYVAPEVLNYDPLGLYTDMWSLGVLTYVMLTTCSPFVGDDKQETFCNITTVNLDFPLDLFEEISDVAQDFIKRLLIAEPSERMTATECMQHEWMTGAVSPNTHVITPARGSEECPQDSDCIARSTSPDTSKSELHVKVKDEISEMSVTEDGESVIRSRTNSESGVRGMELTQADIRQHLSGNVKTLDSDGERVQCIGDGHDTSTLLGEVKPLISEEFPTPDSESSMCISDNRLEDDDSGVGTGTDTRGGSEARTISRRSSTDLITDKEYDTDVVEDLNVDRDHLDVTSEDHDMLSKSLVEKELNETRKCDENKDSIHSDNIRVQGDFNTNNSVTTEEGDESAEMEHSDITEGTVRINEHSNTISEMADKSETNQTSFGVDSSANRIPNIQPMEQSSPSSNRRLNDGSRAITNTNTVDVQWSNSSIGGAEETVQTTPCSGEKHKRVMCNPGSTPGEQNSEGADQEEYEFVSVSKRVKSYEQALTPSPKKEQFSPKIGRSPRLGRHLKTHHQHQ